MKYTEQIFTVFTLTLLLGCSSQINLSKRLANAEQIAQQANMKPISYDFEDFTIQGWRNDLHKNQAAVLYIEGDGFAWISSQRPSLNPTPLTPLGLELATLDKSDNIIYLGRPCQYSKQSCNQKYWTSERYSAYVIEAYNVTLSKLHDTYGIDGFHLVGYSGGANIAALLASRRDDILSLRTVSGNLDNDYLTRYHHVSAMPNSLNAFNNASFLSNLPQIHFSGAKDDIIPDQMVPRWQNKVGSTCSRQTLVEKAGHTTGWKEIWPSLHSIVPYCYAEEQLTSKENTHNT